MKKFKIIKNKCCRMCTSKSFHEVIDLGKHPLVNSLVEKRSKKKILYSQLKLNNVKNVI